MWFPKKKSNILENMLCQLNDALGGAYFSLAIEGNGYVLMPIGDRYTELAVLSPIPFAQMKMYLAGLTRGMRIREKG